MVLRLRFAGSTRMGPFHYCTSSGSLLRLAACWTASLLPRDHSVECWMTCCARGWAIAWSRRDPPSPSRARARG